MLRWLCVFAIGCNELYGLDETRLRPPDTDDDGVIDELDNCPNVANADQIESDGDPFGDACDRCPGLPTLTNHDEDGDRRGDPCDVCPIIPDLGEDLDGDGVGDACEQQPGTTKLEHFDPFVQLRTWTAADVRWELVDDSVAPAMMTSLDDRGLENRDVAIAGDGYMQIGLVSTRAWQPGERFGLGVVDGEGHLLASCDIECTTKCDAIMRIGGVVTGKGNVAARADAFIRFVRVNGIATCLAAGTVVQGPIGSVAGFPVIHGTPAVQTRYFALWSQTP